MIWAAWIGINYAIGWVRLRPEFTIPFEAIELDPAPPREIRSGRETILATVMDRGRHDKPMQILSQDLEELGRSFAKYSPWVSSVDRIRRVYPNRVIVQLTYRVPVARLDMPGDAVGFVGLTADGVVLPGGEIVPEIAKGLIRIARKQSAWDARPGRFLSPDDRGQVAPEVGSALRLARLLRSRDLSDSRIVSLHVDYGPGNLYAKTQRGTWVSWKHGPGEETASEPGTEEKLDRIARWEIANPRFEPKERDHLRFSRDSIEFVPGDSRGDDGLRREDGSSARPVGSKG